SDLGPPLVTEGVIGNDPDTAAGYEDSQEADQQDAGDLIEVPDGLGEEAVGSGMVALLGLAGSLPDPTDGTPSGADDPRRHHVAEEGKGLLAEDNGQGS